MSDLKDDDKTTSCFVIGSRWVVKLPSFAYCVHVRILGVLPTAVELLVNGTVQWWMLSEVKWIGEQ